jgi:DNA polymerase III subunit epsilon
MKKIYHRKIMTQEQSLNFVAIDFETANYRWDSVCACGVTVVENGKIVNKSGWLVRPENLYFHPEHIRLHGITANDVVNKPRFSELWRDGLSTQLQGKILVAHNATFDLNVLEKVLSLYQIPFPFISGLCTVQVARRVWRLSDYRLNTLANYLQLDLQHHNAESDAYACAKILLRACETTNSKSIPQLCHNLQLEYYLPKISRSAQEYQQKNRFI